MSTEDRKPPEPREDLTESARDALDRIQDHMRSGADVVISFSLHQGGVRDYSETVKVRFGCRPGGGD